MPAAPLLAHKDSTAFDPTPGASGFGACVIGTPAPPSSVDSLCLFAGISPPLSFGDQSQKRGPSCEASKHLRYEHAVSRSQETPIAHKPPYEQHVEHRRGDHDCRHRPSPL